MFCMVLFILRVCLIIWLWLLLICKVMLLFGYCWGMLVLRVFGNWFCLWFSWLWRMLFVRFKIMGCVRLMCLLRVWVWVVRLWFGCCRLLVWRWVWFWMLFFSCIMVFGFLIVGVFRREDGLLYWICYL